MQGTEQILLRPAETVRAEWGREAVWGTMSDGHWPDQKKALFFVLLYLFISFGKKAIQTETTQNISRGCGEGGGVPVPLKGCKGGGGQGCAPCCREDSSLWPCESPQAPAHAKAWATPTAVEGDRGKRGCSGQWTSCSTLPHCLGAAGSGPPAIHCLTAWGQCHRPGLAGPCDTPIIRTSVSSTENNLPKFFGPEFLGYSAG